MDAKTLQDIKAKLLSEQQRLTGLLKRTHEHIHRSEPLSPDFAEQSIEVENDVVVEALDREGQIELRQINEALDRINSGNYGLCTQCGNNIQDARLLAIPETGLCISCASANQSAH